MGKWKWLLMGLVLGLFSALSAAAQTADLVDKDTVSSWLGRPDILILDVRTPRDWADSTQKIKGAVRQDPGKVHEWGKTLPPDKTIVLY